MPNLTKLNEFDYTNKTVLLRVDINSPIDKHTKIIVNENRIITCYNSYNKWPYWSLRRKPYGLRWSNAPNWS